MGLTVREGVAIFVAAAGITFGGIAVVCYLASSDGQKSAAEPRIATVIESATGREYAVTEYSHWDLGRSPFQFRTTNGDVVTIRGDYAVRDHNNREYGSLRAFRESTPPSPPPYVPRDGEPLPYNPCDYDKLVPLVSPSHPKFS